MQKNPNYKPFQLGRVVVTRGVAELVPETRLLDCLQLHMQGQWGCLCDEDQRLNDLATHAGERLLSCYPIDPSEPCEGSNRLYLITEWNRSVSTFLLPEEY
jgi:hypothetical protein